MFHLKYNKLLILLAFLLAGCGEKKPTPNPNEQPRGRVIDFTHTVEFKKGTTTISVADVAVADTPSKRNAGLMDVNNLPENAGMIFIFEKEEPQSFWMANTPLSLDIIYVNAAFEIVNIHTFTKPFSESSIPSEAPAKYVVEMNGGYTINHDITIGDSIVFSKK